MNFPSQIQEPAPLVMHRTYPGEDGMRRWLLAVFFLVGCARFASADYLVVIVNLNAPTPSLAGTTMTGGSPGGMMGGTSLPSPPPMTGGMTGSPGGMIGTGGTMLGLASGGIGSGFP